mgnify:CR=1 FL=1
MAEEIQGGLSSAQPQPQAVSDPSVDFSQKYQRMLEEGRKAMDERRRKLLELSSARQSMFDPKLLRLAAGMLAPTKTGSFGESLGYAVSGLAEEQEKEHARQLAEAKLQYELEEQAQKQRRATELPAMMMNLQQRLSAPQAPQVAPAEGAATMGAVPQGVVQQAPIQVAAAPKQATTMFSNVPDSMLQVMALDPEMKNVAEMELKLRDERRKSRTEYVIAGEKRFLYPEEVEEMKNLAARGDIEGLKKFYRSQNLPFNFIEDPSAPGGMRLATAAELEGLKAKASEAEKAKFGEQKEYMIPYGGGTRKFPLTPSQYLEYLNANSKGEGDKYINKLFNIKPGAAVTTAGGVPKTREESEIETAGEKKRVEKRVEAAEATREGLFESSRAARQLIQNSDQIIQLATDPNTKNIFGVFARPDIIGALGTLVTDGARAGNWTISLPSVEKAMRTAGATEEEIKAASVAARIFAQNELGFRKMFLSGQGAVSNMEGAIIPRFSGDMSDSPGAAQAKAEMTKARAELDAAAARTLRQWERRPENAKKNFSDFEDSPEYNRLLDAYDAKLKKIMQVHFPGEKFSSAPNRPAGVSASSRPAAGNVSLERTQPPGVDMNVVNKFKKKIEGR